MNARIGRWTAVVLLLVVATALAAQVDIKPYGRPRARIPGAHYAVWFDEEGWHVRAAAAGEKKGFEGTIEVDGGKIDRVLNFESFETVPAKRKKGKGGVPDSGRVTKNRITFKLRGKEEADSFGFQLSEDVTKVRFRLLIDGEALPRRVFIGENMQNAPTATFELDARPNP
jgi:hypothetical protein